MSAGLMSTGSAASPQERATLRALVDLYLNALVTHDPSCLPLAPTVRFTEDTAAIPVGDGLWVGASEAPADFRIYAIDTTSGQAGFFGLMKEFDSAVLLAMRLKVIDGEIHEIEHVVARHLSERGMANMITPRRGLVTPVTTDERVPRAEMLAVANSYFESIEHCDGALAPFADDAERHENGTQTTTNAAPNPADFGPSEEDQRRLAWAKVDALGCRDQMSCGNLAYITRIRPRRLTIIDEELGLVFGFPTFVHRGNVRTLKIRGVPGVDTLPMGYGPFNLQAGEIFKVRGGGPHGGQIHEVEANGTIVPYGTDCGWPHSEIW